MLHYLISFFVQPPVIAVCTGTLIIVVGLCYGAATKS